MRACAQIAIALLASGCVATEQLTLPPPIEDAKAVVVVVAPRGVEGELSVFAFRSVDEVQLPLTASRANSVNVFLLPYRCELESLGWTPGRIEQAADGDDTRRALPAPMKILQGGFDDDHVLSWTDAVTVPEPLLAIRVKAVGASPCSAFEPRSFKIADTKQSGISLVLDLHDNTVLISPKPEVGRDVQLISVSTSGPTAPVTLAAGTPNNAGFELMGRRILLVGRSGATVIATLQGEITAVNSRASGGIEGAWLDGDDSATGTEIFAVSDDGGFDRFDGVEWHRITAPGARINYGGIARIGPSEAVALGPDSTGILHWNGTSNIEPFTEIGVFNNAVALLPVPDGGALLATDSGGLFERKNGVWRPLAETDDGSRIADIVRFKDGVLVLERQAGRGAIRQFFPPQYFCPPIDFADTFISKLAPYQNGFVAIGEPEDDDASVILVSETTAGSPCLARSILDM